MLDEIQALRMQIDRVSFGSDGYKILDDWLQLFTCSVKTELDFSARSISAYLVVEGALELSIQSGRRQFTSGEVFLSSIFKGVPSKLYAIPTETKHLGIWFDVSIEDIVSVLSEINADGIFAFGEQSNTPSPATGSARLIALTSRILTTLEDGENNPFLKKHFKREFIYRILSGCDGDAFVRHVLNIQNSRNIFSINDWIRENYKTLFSVDELAELANMSVSAFHKKFKTAIGMGPLQCQKQLRLTEARRLMLDEGQTVTNVAFNVGYESLSQFIREYRRVFGLPPGKDIQQLRKRETTELGK